MKIETNKQFNIAVVNGDDYIIVCSDDSEEVMNNMYTWYINHCEFFKGSIQLWGNGKLIAKTNYAEVI